MQIKLILLWVWLQHWIVFFKFTKNDLKYFLKIRGNSANKNQLSSKSTYRKEQTSMHLRKIFSSKDMSFLCSALDYEILRMKKETTFISYMWSFQIVFPSNQILACWDHSIFSNENSGQSSPGHLSPWLEMWAPSLLTLSVPNRLDLQAGDGLCCLSHRAQKPRFNLKTHAAGYECCHAPAVNTQAL